MGHQYCYEVEENGRADNYPVKLNVRDTATGIFWIPRFRSRYPKRQFWISNTPRTHPVNQATYGINSQEAIHSTVRYLWRYMKKQPEGLRAATRPNDPGGSWNLYGTNWFCVHEAAVSPVERAGLLGWLDKNRRELGKHQALGQPPPGTVIAEVMARL